MCALVLARAALSGLWVREWDHKILPADIAPVSPSNNLHNVKKKVVLLGSAYV